MTWDERVRAVTPLGFTERQAGFLVMVMLHGGVCLGRHYCTFARIAYGQKMHDFFRKLVEGGFATSRACRHGKARLYHVHHKPLYRAIGEPDSRHRKPTILARAVERLMVLDAVLEQERGAWLSTERDKTAHFTLVRPTDRDQLPSLTFRSGDKVTIRYFIDNYPIGVSDDGQRYTFLYLVHQDVPIDFRAFLERHAELLRSLPFWTVKLLVPSHLRDAAPLYAEAFVEQLAAPLRPSARDELAWFFQARRAHSGHEASRFETAQRAFRGPRFQALYRAWLERGDGVVAATVSPTLADTIARARGSLECHVLPHRYRHLAPLVGTA